MVVLSLAGEFPQAVRRLSDAKGARRTCRWQPRTGQLLRDCLRELRELGEINFDKTQGEEDPYVIAIITDDFFEFQRGKLETDVSPAEFEVALSRLKSEQARQ